MARMLHPTLGTLHAVTNLVDGLPEDMTVASLMART